MKFHAIGDSRPNTLLKQEGLELAEASFRDHDKYTTEYILRVLAVILTNDV